MSINVRIPTPLRKFTAGQDIVAVEGINVGDALRNLDSAHPGILSKICTEEGKVRRFINVYAGDDDVRFLEGLETSLNDGSEISIVPAIAGG